MKAEDNQFPYVTFTEEPGTPVTPGAGLAKLYRKSDGLFYYVDDTGTETPIGSGSTGGGGSNTMDPNPQTTDYTLVASDAGKAVEVTSATAATVMVPPNSSVAFPVGTIIDIYQGGAGQVSLAAGAGVTIRNNAPLRGQYAEASLRKRGTDEWVLTGDTVATSAPALKDYAEVMRTSGNLTLNQTAVTPVSTSLDLTLAAAAGDLVSFGMTGLLASASAAICLDVFTVPSGSTVNPFGVGLDPATSLQGVPGWESVSADGTVRLTGEVTRVLTAADVANGLTILRLLYRSNNTTGRVLYAGTTIPLKVWAKNHGPA